MKPSARLKKHLIKLPKRLPKIVSKPVLVKFYTKTGKPIFFKGKKFVVSKPKKIDFYEKKKIITKIPINIEELTGKELVKWLKKEGFKNLAKVLNKISK